MHTMILLNPSSGGGRAGKMFQRIEPQLHEALGDCLVAITHDVDAVARHIDFAAAAGIRRIIAVGGDGTNHAVLNALAARPDLNIEFGTIPMGTGRDWSRSLGLSLNPDDFATWLHNVRPTPCDIGRIEYADPQRGGMPASRVFLNEASGGIPGHIAALVNRTQRRGHATFLWCSIKSLCSYTPPYLRIECDGEPFYEGPTLLFTTANGRSFGHGMYIAPHALLDDGAFDVIVIEAMSRLKALRSMPSLYTGRHLTHREVHSTRARSIVIRTMDGPVNIECDGETIAGNDVRITVMPRAINMLLDPQRAAVCESRT